MTNDERRFLEHMRQLLAKGWIQGDFATDEEEHSCLITDPQAVYFCMLGAAMRSRDDLHIPMERIQLARLLFHEPGYDIPRWNDRPGRTKSEVLAKIDAALA